MDLVNGSSSILEQHGTHVAGIAIGAMKGDRDPHGIAYNGKYYGLGKQNPSLSYTGNLYEDVKNWNVKIINNSWVAIGIRSIIATIQILAMLSLIKIARQLVRIIISTRF